MYFSSGIVWSHPNSGKGLFPSDVVRFVMSRRPVTAFGIPGVIVLGIGVVLALQALEISAKTGFWSPTITLVSMMMLVMGMLLCSVAMILYAVAQMIGMLRVE